MFPIFKRAFSRPFRDIFINQLAAYSLFSSWTRGFFYKAYGMQIGKNIGYGQDANLVAAI